MADLTINNDMTMGAATGTLLAGRYRVVKQLGQGGMGSVWLAEDTKLDGFKVAIKMLPSVLVNNKRAYAQVKADALVSLKLSHPNIVTVRAFEEEGGNPFLVMDYIDGQTLDDYLAEKGKLTEEETVKLLKPVAAALDYAHTQGVVHRDVKPGNVMIRKDGTPFVLDFGIAREIQETMTRVTGKLSSGTLLYMSPEQLNGDAPKPAQDIYSFAAMVYECLKGEPPFTRGGVEDQIKHKAPEPLGPQFIKCGLGVMAGMAKSPEPRPATCAAVLEEGGKRGAKAGTGTSASKTRIAVVWALLALSALVGVGGWFGWSAYCRAEKNRLAMIKVEMERKRIADKVAAMTKAFDGFRFNEIVNDPESEKIPELRFLSGIVYENGLGGVSPDLKRAVALYGGTTGVSALAEAHLAQMLLSGDYLDKDASETTTNRIVACLPEIQSRADMGETLAACVLHDIYDDGIGVKKDRQLGKKWLERAASGGNVFAKYLLAASVYRGDDVYPMDRNRYATLMREVEPAQWYACFCLRGMLCMQEKQRDLAEQDLLRALPTIRSLARQGSAEAQHVLGDMYNDGCGVPKDPEEAFRWHRLAAEKGDASAQAALAIAYCRGAGVDKDEKEAVRWARKAAEQGNSLGQDILGVFYRDGIGVEKSPEEAFLLFKKSAENGQLEAMEFLGDCYRNGTGVTVDKGEAVRWYRKAAVKGHEGASNMLGFVLEHGEGCEKNEVEAVAWYQKAADKGHEVAQWNLGLCYLEGRPGVLKDEVRAYELMRNCAKRGMALAQNMVGWMLEYGKGSSPNVEEAVDWYRKAADQGLSVAQWNLGLCYEYGKGVQKDLKAAYDWILKAAEQGRADAQARVGWMLEDGRGCERDLAAARQWYQKAVEQNSSLAENNLGVLYMDGKGVEKSDRLAKYWLERAMQHGNTKAPYNLGLMYKDGRCGPVNMREARRLLKQAEENGDADAKRVLDSIGRRD